MIDPATAVYSLGRFLGIRGGIALVLGIALAFVIIRADSLSGQRDAAQAALAGEQARHAVTRASVELLSDKLEGFVREGELRQERVTEALADVAKETAKLRDEAKDFDIETVEGL